MGGLCIIGKLTKGNLEKDGEKNEKLEISKGSQVEMKR